MKTLQKLCAALALAGLACSAQASGRMVITPSATSTAPGSSFSVDVRGADFTDIVVGGGFNLSFDASLLSLDSVVIDTSWEFARSGGLIDNASGTLSDAYAVARLAGGAGDGRAVLALRADAHAAPGRPLQPAPRLEQPAVAGGPAPGVAAAGAGAAARVPAQALQGQPALARPRSAVDEAFIERHGPGAARTRKARCSSTSTSTSRTRPRTCWRCCRTAATGCRAG
jgi:hypothetical protein